MSRRCSVCQQEDRERIDSLLVCGESLRTIARQYPPLTVSALSRHHNRHLSPALAAMEVAREETEQATVQAEVRDLITRAKRILSTAEADGHSATALQAVARLHPLLETLGKLTGELDERPVVTVNLLSSPEILAALNVVYGELADLPEVRQRIAARLQPERLQLEAPK